MNKKSGVTLIMLIVTMIIMATILSVVVINGTDIYYDAKKTKLNAEITQLELLMENYIKRTNKSSWTDDEIVELDLSGYTEEEKNQFAGEDINDNKVVLYMIDLEAIDAEEVSYGNGEQGEQDRYLYSAVTQKVYYELGRKIGETVYHRIDE